MSNTEIYFNPWDPAFRANPYPHYKPLYDGPPHLIDLMGPTVLAARYKDVVSILRNPEHFSSVQPRIEGFEQQMDVFGGGTTMLFADPPVHTRLRRLVSRAFTPRRIRDLEPRIREMTAKLLDAAQARGCVDVMADIANPLPVMVISEMLGVPSAQYRQFKHWSDAIVSADNTLPGMPMPPEIMQANRELRDYFLKDIERRRREPGDDLVSALIAVHEETDELSANDLFAFVVLLLLAGNETTTNLIGNGMNALGRNPDQLERLRAEPALLPTAIDEMLRYDGPVQSTVRYATADVNLAGTPMTKGQNVFVMVAAADRDPAQFPEPDKFDITRTPNEHVAFGEGIHFCLGSALARLEGAVAVGAMLERFPRLRLAEPDAPLTYKGSYFLRGLSELKMATN